jgi:predicted O-methyltransferase YrrM
VSTVDRVDGDAPVAWTADDEFAVDGTAFAVVEFGATGHGSRPGPPSPGALHIYKSRDQVESYVDLITAVQASRVVELGIKAGGSTALLVQLARPSKLVAVDIAAHPVAALEAFLDAHALRDAVRPYYGVDQADGRRLTGIVEGEFGADPIDLVIDDASHLPGPTRASFDVLFPRLCEDGLYVIEDWSWEHAIASKMVLALSSGGPPARVPISDILQTFGALGMSSETLAPLRAGEFLSDLVAEIVVAKADGDPTIGDVTIGPFVTEIRRGSQRGARSDLAAELGSAAPAHVLHVGPLDADVGRQLAGAGTRRLVVVSPEPPAGGDPSVATTHVRGDPSSAPRSEIVRQVDEAAFDLVVDGTRPDAAQARELASVLLPRLAPGGSYLLRGWPHLVTPRTADDGGASWRRLPPLLLELILSVGEWGGTVEEVSFGAEWLRCRPGAHRLTVESFDLGQLYEDHLESLERP